MKKAKVTACTFPTRNDVEQTGMYISINKYI